MKAKSKRTKAPKALTGNRLADNIFAGLETHQRQQFGRTFGRGRRGGR